MDTVSWEVELRRLERRRWQVWVPLALAFLIVYFHRVSSGVVADSLMREFQIERAAELGLLSSIYFYTYASLQIPAGILADRVSLRRTITLSLLVTAGGAIAFGMADTLTWLYAARFMVGLGVAFIYISIVKTIAEWFRTREFGTMSGLNSFIGNAGSIVAATPLAFMVEGLGWRVSFYVIGLATLAVAAYCWLVVRDKPADVGLPAITEVEAREGISVPASALEKQDVWPSLRTVMTNRYTWPPVLAATGVYGVYMAFTGMWGVPYFMQTYGMSRVEAANYLVASAVGYMLAGPLIGFLSDRLRCRRWPFVLYTAVILAGWLVMTLWNQGKPPEWVLYPLSFILGAGTSGVSLMLACAREVNPAGIAGMAMGLANTGPFLGAALIQPLFGWMLDLNWDGKTVQGVKIYPLAAYDAAFMLCGGILLIALVFALLIKETKCANIGHLLVIKNDRGDCK